MADGDITLTVDLSVQDVKQKAVALQAEIRKIFENSSNGKLDANMQKALATMSKLSTRAAEISRQMEIMENTHVVNPGLEKLVREMTAIEDEIVRIQTQGDIGVSTVESEKHVDELRNKLGELENAYTEMATNARMVTLADAHPEMYDALKNSLGEVNNEMSMAVNNAEEMGMASSKIGVVFNALKNIGGKVGQVFSVIGRGTAVAIKGVTRLGKAITSKLGSALSKVKSMADRTFSFKNLTLGIKRIAMLALGVHGITAAFNKLKNAAKEGLQNLVQFNNGSNSANQAMTSLNSSLLYLKNAWAAAFAPILTFVMPMLTALIDRMASVGNAIAKFIGALTGQKTVLNATKTSAGNYAKSLDKTKKKAGGASKAQKQLNDRLASFDDLNVLGKDKDTGAGGGGGAGMGDLGGLDPDKMFKKVKAVSDLADKIKEAWKNADFTALGEEFRNKLLSALSGIDWGKIQEVAYKVGKSIATFLNGALGDPALWESTGDLVAQGLNTITDAIAGFLENNTVDFGGGFASLINSFFENTDWGTVRSNIELFGQQLLENINSFFHNLNFHQISVDLSGLAESITTALVNLIAGIDWNKVTQGFSQLGLSILQGIENGFKQSDNPIMQGIGDIIGGVKEALSTLLPVVQQIFTAVQPIISAILPVIASILPQIATLISDVATLVLPLISSVLQVITPVVEKLVTAILPILHNILVALQPAFQVLTDTILPILSELLDAIMPVIESILNAVSAILVPIANLLAPLLQLVGAILEPLIEVLKPILATVSILIDEVANILGPIIDLIAPLIELITSCLSPVLELFGFLANCISTVVVPAMKLVSGIIQAVVITTLKVLTGIISVVASAFQKFAEIIKLAFDGLKNALQATWNFIKPIINSILGGIEKMANGVIKGINSAINAINGLHFTLPDWVPIVGGKSLGFKIKELSTISIPRLAEGAVIPPNREFMAVLGDQPSGTNIEAPLDTIKQAVAEVMANNGNAEVVQLLQQLIGVVEHKQLTVGDKEIGKANARYTNKQRIIRGTSF